MQSLVICAHPPHVDPRIGWHVSSLRRYSKVNILSIGGKVKEIRNDDNLRFVENFWQAEPVRPPFKGPLMRIYPFLKKQVMRRSSLLPRIVTNFGLILLTFWRIHATFHKLRKASNGFDEACGIIVANDIEALRIGVDLKKRCGGVLVYDCHENWACIRPFAGELFGHMMNKYQKKHMKSVDIVTTVSPLLVNYLEQRLSITNVLLLPNAAPSGGNQDTVSAEGEEERRTRYASELGEIAQGRLIALFQGRVAPERGLREIVTAWTYVPQDKAVLAIRAPLGLNEELEAVIDIAKTEGTYERSVFLLQPVKERDLITAASAADVGIIPYKPTFGNHLMACPNKLSQYLQAGLAIFANDIPYVRTVVEDAKCGYIYTCRDGPRHMSDMIMALARDRGKLNVYKRNAARYARETFHWDAFYTSVEERIHENMCTSQRDIRSDGAGQFTDCS